MTDLSGAVAASCCNQVGERTTRRDPDRLGTKPGRLTPTEWAENYVLHRSSGMDGRRRRRNREGRGEPTRLNRWRRRLAESMPSPGTAKPGRAAKPRPWPTGVGNRRPTRCGGGRGLRGCSGGPKAGRRKPATVGWRAGGRTRDALLGHTYFHRVFMACGWR